MSLKTTLTVDYGLQATRFILLCHQQLYFHPPCSPLLLHNRIQFLNNVLGLILDWLEIGMLILMAWVYFLMGFPTHRKYDLYPIMWDHHDSLSTHDTCCFILESTKLKMIENVDLCESNSYGDNLSVQLHCNRSMSTKQVFLYHWIKKTNKTRSTIS